MAAIAGAAIFTGGAALSLTGSWGSFAAKAASTLGLKGTMAKMVAGSITHAGWGAAAGGVVGSLTGQGFWDGAQAGLAIGAGTGAASGLLLPGAAASAGAVDPVTGRSLQGALGIGQAAADQAVAAASPGILGTAGTVAKHGTGIVGQLKNAASKVLSDGNVVGPLLRGVGEGLAADSEIDYMRERDARNRERSSGTHRYLFARG